MLSTKTLVPLTLALVASSAAAQSILAQHGEVVQSLLDVTTAFGGATISDFGNVPYLDLNGNMVWQSRLTGGTTVNNTDDRAIFYGRTNGDLEVVLYAGQDEPSGTFPGAKVYLSSGTSGAISSNGVPSNILISPTGGFLLMGLALNGPGIQATGTVATGKNDTAVYWGPRNALQILIQRGGFAPTGGSQYDTSFSNFSLQSMGLNAQGVALAKVHLAGGDAVTGVSDDAWLIGVPGNVNWMCRESDPLFGGIVTVGAIGFTALIDEQGRVFHDETLSTTGGTTPATAADDKVLLLYVPGTGQVQVMREGDPAPGTPGCLYGSPTLSTHDFSRSTGMMAFQCGLTGGNVTGANDDGALFAGTIGNIQLVAREGDPAPTGNAGETYGQAIFTSNHAIVDNGTVVFQASIAGASVTPANDMAIFYGTPGNIQAIIREGDAVPGMPGMFVGNTGNSGIGNGTAILMNERGQVVVNVNIYDGVSGGTATNLCYDPEFGVQVLSINGETLTVNGNPEVTSNQNLGAVNNSGDGTCLGLNNAGDLCLRAFFSSGPIAKSLIRTHLGSLQGDTASIPATGGAQNFSIDAGTANAGKLYFVAGCLTGFRPGFDILGAHIPLNNDVWFTLSALAANSATYPNSWGLLDANGHATSGFVFPSGFSGFLGATFHHACAVIDPSPLAIPHVSAPVSVRLY